MKLHGAVPLSAAVGPFALAALIVCSPVVCAQQTKVIDRPVATYSLTDDAQPYGQISVDDLAYVGDNLWVLDRSGKRLYQIDPEAKRIAVSFDAPTADPAGLAFDRTGLLVSDAKSHVVYRVDPRDGASTELVDLNDCTKAGDVSLAPSDLPELSALASDGTYLWAAFTAGYSSSIFKIDPETKTIVDHMWANGPQPKGLYWDGTHLISIDSRNNEMRRYDGSGKQVGIAKLPTASPRGLAFRADRFMTFDPQRRELVEISWVD